MGGRYENKDVEGDMEYHDTSGVSVLGCDGQRYSMDESTVRESLTVDDQGCNPQSSGPLVFRTLRSCDARHAPPYSPPMQSAAPVARRRRRRPMDVPCVPISQWHEHKRMP